MRIPGQCGGPAALVLAAAVASSACTDKLIRGASYQLVRASNNPLPLLLRADSACEHMLYGGRVEFDGRGGFQSTFDIRKLCGDSVAPVPDPGTKGTFKVRNDTAHFTSAGKPAGFGVITADSLIVAGPIHRLAYVRDREEQKQAP